MNTLLQSLGTIEWSDQKKTRVKEALTLHYMSTEESGCEGDEKVFIVHDLHWESNRLRSYKEMLWKHQHVGNKPGQFRSFRRKRNVVASNRPPPQLPIEWAVKQIN